MSEPDSHYSVDQEHSTNLRPIVHNIYSCIQTSFCAFTIDHNNLLWLFLSWVFPIFVLIHYTL